MKGYIGIPDSDWYTFLAARAATLDEVNFWQPSGGRAFRALEPESSSSSSSTPLATSSWAGACSVVSRSCRPASPGRHSARRTEPALLTLTLPLLGQGTFRILVTDLYDRRCTVTRERTLPVPQAAHIKPYAASGPHHPQNGLLLRSDIHTLFDRGYVTVTPERRLEVSRRFREEFASGRDYYALQGRELRSPARDEMAPATESLEWHANHVFRG